MQPIGVMTVSIAEDKRKLLEKFKHIYGVVHYCLYCLKVKLKLVLINFSEKMEVLAIFCKPSEEAGFVSKLKNGLTWPAKLV